jgi:hypothetical protein
MAEEKEKFPKPNGRTHTDFFCCIAFLACLTVSGLLVFYSFIEGNTQRLTHGFDWDGKLCGIDTGVEDKPFLYFCGSMQRQGDYPISLNPQSAACVKSCPTNTSDSIACLMKEFRNFTDLGYLKSGNLTFRETLNLDITQTVTLQQSYPTEVFHERFCVPTKSEDNMLRSFIVDGPLRQQTRIAMAVASFRHAWPVIIVTALLAVILGLCYLYALKNYAGPLIFASLITAAVLMAILGVFYVFGIFMNPWNTEGTYQQLNLIFRTFPGWAGYAYSVLVGGFLLLLAAALAWTTYSSIDKIDESIGVIQAACDCMFASGPGKFDLLTHPIIFGVSMMVLIVLLVYGGLCISTIGSMRDDDIHFNDEAIEGLRKEFVQPAGWYWVLVFYVFCSIWLLEVTIALSQFVVSFAVCSWYFVKLDEKEGTDNSLPYLDAAKGKHQKKVDNVRVHGVEGTQGERSGYVENGPQGKVLVVPIGRRGPGAKDFMTVDDHNWEKDMEFGICLQGTTCALWYHLGSLALGALIVPVTRPLRWTAQAIKALLGSGKGDQDQPNGGVYDDNEDKPILGICTGGCGLLAGVLDHIFGGYGKMAYADIVLSSSDFWTAGKDAFNFVVQAGGVVAFLHGGTALYEMIGIFCITVTCGFLSHIMLTHIPWFSHEDSAWYVSAPWMMTLLSSFSSLLIAHGFMSLFNVTADTLLYVFAWSRKWYADDIRKYCPPSLRNLVSEEMDVAPTAGLEPQGNTTMTRFSHALSTYKGQAKAVMTRTGGPFTGPPPGADVFNSASNGGGERNWLLSGQ